MSEPGNGGVVRGSWMVFATKTCSGKYVSYLDLTKTVLDHVSVSIQLIHTIQ